QKSQNEGRGFMDVRKMMNDDEILTLCDVIRQTSYDIHIYLGHGHLEKVYENALAHRLIKQKGALLLPFPFSPFVTFVIPFVTFVVNLPYQRNLHFSSTEMSEMIHHKGHKGTTKVTKSQKGSFLLLFL